MKKYIISLVMFSFFSLFVSSVVFAGGGLEEEMMNPDGTIKTSMSSVDGTYTDAEGVTYDENGNVISQKAEAFSAMKALGTPLGLGTIALVLVVLGVGYLSWRKDRSNI